MRWNRLDRKRRLEDQELEALETLLQSNLVMVRARPEFTRRLHDTLLSDPEVELDWIEPVERRSHPLLVAAGAFSAVVLVILGVRTIGWVVGSSARRDK